MVRQIRKRGIHDLPFITGEPMPGFFRAICGLPIRVLIVDDHKLLREGIRSLLKKENDIEIIGEAPDGNEALRLIEIHRPDVVLMDTFLPGISGLAATAWVSRIYPYTHVIMLSMSRGSEFILGIPDIPIHPRYHVIHEQWK